MRKKRKYFSFQALGLLLAGVFYLISCISELLISNAKNIIDPSLETITFAHWQLEDGFREGYDEAIKMFEAYKAKQGKKVKIIQTAVPFRGYKQWFLTQLIGGSPADVIELTGPSAQRNQYFTPLSTYISKPNPFNKDTQFEGVPWKNTYIDNMNSALDTKYGEYFGVGTLSAVYRIYVNLQLLEAATGSRKLPETVDEWLVACEKIKAYKKTVSQPIIPIGVRGFDKGTLNYLLNYYFSQMNSDLHDRLPENCSPNAIQSDILNGFAHGEISKEKLFGVVDIVKDIGGNFGDGFSATDLEQTKFLFFAGYVVFFPEGTWNAYSIVKNSPFEVAIMEFPLIGGENKFSEFFVGRPTEQGLGVGGQFGIPKASKHFDLALEFLQFITSWKINQMTMADYCKWLPAVKKAKYTGILADCKPNVASGRRQINPPFYTAAKSKRKILEFMESIIVEDKQNPRNLFYNEFIKSIPLLIEENEEAVTGNRRTLFFMDAQISAANVGLLRSDLSPEEKSQLLQRYNLMLENCVNGNKRITDAKRCLKTLRDLQNREK